MYKESKKIVSDWGGRGGEGRTGRKEREPRSCQRKRKKKKPVWETELFHNILKPKLAQIEKISPFLIRFLFPPSTISTALK